jgi:hypothetical protein
MAKYLYIASYTTEGLKGLLKDGGFTIPCLTLRQFRLTCRDWMVYARSARQTHVVRNLQ